MISLSNRGRDTLLMLAAIIILALIARIGWSCLLMGWWP